SFSASRSGHRPSPSATPAPPSCRPSATACRPVRRMHRISRSPSPARASSSDHSIMRPMFESAELGHRIDKERYAREEPELRHALLEAQYELVKTARFRAVILIGGVDGAGKGETLNTLNEWMDPRHIQTSAFRPLQDDLDGRPPMWQFWRALPPNGRIAIFV